MSAASETMDASQYPLRFEVEYPGQLNCWLPLVKWLLAIPHLLIIYALLGVVNIIHLIAFFAILFTTKYPQPLFEFVVNIYRWQSNVTAYIGLMRDEYPPFMGARTVSRHVRNRISGPAQPLVASRRMATCHSPLRCASGFVHRRRCRLDHRLLFDSLYHELPERHVRFQRRRAALVATRERVRLLHARRVPAVQLEVETPSNHRRSAPGTPAAG